MAAEKENGSGSENENGERPVREKLQKASIDAQALNADSETATAPADVAESAEKTESVPENGNAPADIAAPETTKPVARLEKKRSHEDMEDGRPEAERTPHHTRKRSRDSAGEEEELKNGHRKLSAEQPSEAATDEAPKAEDAKSTSLKRPGTPEVKTLDPEAAAEAVASPKTKRTRHDATSEETATASDVPTTTAAGSTDATEKPKSGFSNTSTASPFATSADSAQSSTSAFNSSGFKALSGSTTSGFGAVGKTSGGFGSGGSFASAPKDKPSGEEETKPASTFGGALGQKSAFAVAPGTSSGFGSGASGFGKLGQTSAGGFGGAFGGAGFGGLAKGGLTSFASGGAKLGTSAKPAKPFGAPADDDEYDDNDEEDGEPAENNITLATEAEKQDERFYEQELETGEEDEQIEFTCRAKLYNFSTLADGKKEWRERGFGPLRLNVKKTTEQSEAPQARLVMRAEGSHRVILNTKIIKNLKFGDPKGGAPQGGYMFFMGAMFNADGNEGGLELLQLKMRQQNVLELYDRIQKLQEAM